MSTYAIVRAHAIFKRILYERYLEIYKVLEIGASEELRNILREYFIRRIEIDNIKLAIRAKVANRKITPRELSPIKVCIDLEKIVKARDIRSLIDYAKRCYPSIKDAYRIYEETRVIDPVEVSLDVDYYRRIKDVALDAGLYSIEKLVNEEIELKWLKWALNFKLRKNIKPEHYLGLLNKLSCPLSAWMTLDLYEENINNFIRKLRRYKKYYELMIDLEHLIAKREYVLLDLAFKKAFYKIIGKYVKENPLDPVYVFSIILLIKREIDNLLTIFLSKEAKFSREETLSFIIV